MKSMDQRPPSGGYKKGDVLVLFGELFEKGYANGLVEEGQRQGMTIVRSTLGRRGADGSLGPLNDSERLSQPEPLINIPLEAGFDRDQDSQGISPCDRLQGVKVKEWDQDHLNWDSVLESQAQGRKRFRESVTQYMEALKTHIPEGANVLFAHTMAGGVPRAKILMAVMNRVFKGRGDRFIPSEALFHSQLGRMGQLNFSDVTAHTFKDLVELSTEIRDMVEGWGGQCSYTAYGYHGTKILLGDEYQWQTYTPYFQGWAKMELENHSREFSAQGIRCCVYNCPEILTNSSSIFQGVEVSLYPLLGAIQKEGKDSKYCRAFLENLGNMIKEEHSFEEVMEFTHRYVQHPLIQAHSDFDQWPQHNSKEQMAHMLDSSNHLIAMHKDPKKLMTLPLSEEVFKATGALMLHDSWTCAEPVLWLNHNIVAQSMAANPHF